MPNGITIVICTYNGSSRMEKVLQSILHLNTINNFELIIVDNNSSDNTQLVCTEILKKSSLDCRILTEMNQGLSYARLRGLKEAKYEIVIFCDDDNYLDPDYIRIGYDLMNSHDDIGALGGCGYPVFESKPPHWFEKYSYSFAVGAQADKSGYLTEYPAELYGAGCFFRKNVILNFYINGFTPIMSDRKGQSLVSGGDVEWCYLVQLAGYRLYYDDRLRFGHLMPISRLTWVYYLRLKKGIASGACRLLSYHLLFKKRDSSLFAFLLSWFISFVKSGSIYFRLRLKTLFKSPKSPEIQLTQKIWKAKCLSYINDFSITKNHFLILKRLLSNA